MNFERGRDPKEALEIGGIDIGKKYEETAGIGLRKWEEFYSQFVGKTITFHVNRRIYCNWDDRVANGELSEIKTMLVKKADTHYSPQEGTLYFMEEGSNQCWFPDLSQKIYYGIRKNI